MSCTSSAQPRSSLLRALLRPACPKDWCGAAQVHRLASTTVSGLWTKWPWKEQSAVKVKLQQVNARHSKVKTLGHSINKSFRITKGILYQHIQVLSSSMQVPGETSWHGWQILFPMLFSSVQSTNTTCWVWDTPQTIKSCHGVSYPRDVLASQGEIKPSRPSLFIPNYHQMNHSDFPG